MYTLTKGIVPIATFDNFKSACQLAVREGGTIEEPILIWHLDEALNCAGRLCEVYGDKVCFYFATDKE